MSATPRTDAAEYTWMNAGCDDVPVVNVDISRALERELSAVTAERDALRKIVGDMLLYWQTGNGVTVERATIRHDDPIVEAMRDALRKEQK